MKHLILTLLVTFPVIFHSVARKPLKNGRVREVFCACWCVDAVFAICGTLLSFGLYHYELLSFLTIRNAALGLLYLFVTCLLVLLAPSGFSLITKWRAPSGEETLLAEYRFNDTLSMVRNFFLALLFSIPILLILLERSPLPLTFLQAWDADRLCGGLCFGSRLRELKGSQKCWRYACKYLQRYAYRGC